MKILIFSDLDGTFMNHQSYSYSDLNSFVSRIKRKSEIIFNSSKTFFEMIKVYKKLNLKSPFIVENGGCIFFPSDYLNFKKIEEDFFKFENFIGLSLSEKNKDELKNNINEIKFKNNFKFSFFSELNNEQLINLTNLKKEEINDCKKRGFSDPIYWEDNNSNFKIFKKKLEFKNINIFKGGRFVHFSSGYDKGVAVNKFLEIYKKQKSNKFFTISLGDSENDLSMLELTNYSCLIKSSKKKEKLYLKKTSNNYYSEKEAPLGWKESLEYIVDSLK